MPNLLNQSYFGHLLFKTQIKLHYLFFILGFSDKWLNIQKLIIKKDKFTGMHSFSPLSELPKKTLFTYDKVQYDLF